MKYGSKVPSRNHNDEEQQKSHVTFYLYIYLSGTFALASPGPINQLSDPTLHPQTSGNCVQKFER